jgi:hypothetical protein
VADLEARPTDGEDGWASMGLEGKGSFSQRCFAQSTQRAQRVGFLAEVFLAEHAEGAEGWVSRRARRGAEDWVSRRGAEGAEVDRLKAVARLPLNGYRDMLGG